MQDELFAWDDAKAASNWRDHGVTFEMAREVFKDPEGRLLFVAYTMRGEVIRIISPRKAQSYERRRYHEDNGRT